MPDKILGTQNVDCALSGQLCSVRRCRDAKLHALSQPPQQPHPPFHAPGVFRTPTSCRLLPHVAPTPLVLPPVVLLPECSGPSRTHPFPPWPPSSVLRQPGPHSNVLAFYAPDASSNPQQNANRPSHPWPRAASARFPSSETHQPAALSPRTC